MKLSITLEDGQELIRDKFLPKDVLVLELQPTAKDITEEEFKEFVGWANVLFGVYGYRISGYGSRDKLVEYYNTLKQREELSREFPEAL